MDACSDLYNSLVAQWGGAAPPCHADDPVVYVNSPTDLADGLMPFIELVMIGGALLALAHALRCLRRDRDAVPLGVWVAALVYVLVLEPPLYFPEAFGLKDSVGLVFIHNEFTVGLLYGRMPLYIAMLYPAMVYLAWTVVRRWNLQPTGGLVRRALVTGVCIGAVHHVFYEIFDMIGPQRDWWYWNPDVDTNEPLIGSVPVSSMVNFAFVMPAAFAFLVVVILERRPRVTAASIVGPAILVGALTPLASAPGQLPITLANVDAIPDVVHRGLLIAMVAAGAWVALHGFLKARPEPAPDRYLLVHGAGYLVAMAALWAVALPETLDGGSGVGNLPYVVGCFAAATAVLIRTATPAATRVSPGGAAAVHT